MFEFKIEKPSRAPAPFQEQLVRSIEEKALDLIEKRFGDSSDGENRLAFHNAEHTKGVMRRTESILRAIQKVTVHRVAEKDVVLGRLAAAFHDVVQESEEQDKDGKLVRQRFTGRNEKKSADEAITFLEWEMKELEGSGFSEEDFAVIEDAIRGTVPDFSVEKKTVIQPNVTEQSSLISRAVALADLGTAGMDGAEAFLREGDALFREENLDITRALKNREPIEDELKEAYRDRMIEWAKGQPVFALKRQELLEEELRGMPPGADVAIKKLFNTFDESIAEAAKRAEARVSLSFDELALDMGFLDKKMMNH